MTDRWWIERANGERVEVTDHVDVARDERGVLMFWFKEGPFELQDGDALRLRLELVQS